MTFPVEVARGVPVVTAPEEVDYTNAAGLRAAVAEAAARGGGPFVIDLAGTRFCDTAGVHVLVSAYLQARSQGRQVLLVTSASILRIFAIAGLDRVIPHFTSLAQALAHAPGKPPAAPPGHHADA